MRHSKHVCFFFLKISGNKYFRDLKNINRFIITSPDCYKSYFVYIGEKKHKERPFPWRLVSDSLNCDDLPCILNYFFYKKQQRFLLRRAKYKIQGMFFKANPILFYEHEK